MKAAILILLFAVCYTECRKTYVPINKNANLDFINMEGGGGVRPGGTKPAGPVIPAPAGPAPAVPAKPQATSTPVVSKPQAPIPQTSTSKSVPAPTTVKASVPASPQPNQIKPKPVYPSPVANPITTPGPGSVKQLVNFYDSQGKASPIRPYSYSQAVKQG